MIFLTIVTPIVYWAMDHNNPRKYIERRERELQEILKVPLTGDESLVDYTREVIKQQIDSYYPPAAQSSSSKSSEVQEVQKELITKPYSFSDNHPCTGCSYDDHSRRQSWENYQMDYTGRDSFDNILSKLNQSLTTETSHPHTDSYLNKTGKGNAVGKKFIKNYELVEFKGKGKRGNKKDKKIKNCLE